MWKKENRRDCVYTIPRKREVLSVKFQEELEQREESGACTILGEGEREIIYVLFLCR